MQNYENENKDPNQKDNKRKNNPGARKPVPNLSWREYDDFKSKARLILTADYYTVPQTAKILGNSPKSVSRCIEVGKLPHCLNNFSQWDPTPYANSSGFR